MGQSSNYNLTRSMLEFQVQHLMSQPNCMIKVRLLSCHNQNGRQPQPKWKTTSTKMEDNLTQNGRRPHPKWKTTKMEVPRSDEVLLCYSLEGPPFENKELLLHHTIFIQQSDCKLLKTASKNSSKIVIHTILLFTCKFNFFQFAILSM